MIENFSIAVRLLNIQNDKLARMISRRHLQFFAMEEQLLPFLPMF